MILGLRQVVKSGKLNGNWYYAIGTYFVRYDDRPPGQAAGRR